MSICFAVLLFAVSGVRAPAEDGYRLWMRYDTLADANAQAWRSSINTVVIPGDSPTMRAILAELVPALSGLLGKSIAASANNTLADGTLVVGTPSTSSAIASLQLRDALAKVGDEGFLIRSEKIDGRSVTVIAASTELGALYGAFHFLRLVQTQPASGNLNISEKPRFLFRLLNHWDNLDGSIERGYAGQSLWKWNELPGTIDPRLTDYARASASLGINGAVLNNVNADAKSLTPEYLRKAAAIADVFRPYGVRVYLVPRFSAPIEIDGLETADPLDPKVAAWWKAKTDEIYKLIPDFGGYLVKANSEGQPGPMTYGRTHADGANMLAAAVARYGGIVMWRAFIYDPVPGSDRAAEAYNTLKPFDGKFAPNVILQVKNGPVDFMPREPFHPIFGSMPHTQVMPEVQITQEYLGHSNSIAFLATMWREFLDSDTYAKGPGSTVTRVVDGRLYGQTLTAIAGVANTGDDRNWTGHHLAQANWFAYGRLAWNPDMSAREIADEWTEMTLTHDRKSVDEIVRLLLESREAVVNYEMPLGLAHLMDNPHYGPGPWGYPVARPDWSPVYYHRAANDGIGFDRTATGTNAVAQYHEPLRSRYADLSTCPDDMLLWFHHVPWTYKMRSGRTLWDELCLRYQRGVDWTGDARKRWDALAGIIDAERHTAVARKLVIQQRDAKWWRDAGLLYFQTFSKQPFPADVDQPTRTLDEVKALDDYGHPQKAKK
ncbi:alpha-glucuronidase [Termitidicoccus mucosus]|uniref:Xylan alpha-1,2-glucuronidase n=1 Tax=Termitidicoccus mucosus TaxID=1184151 RepID=A0A178IK08_9BACT|nr:alpha-glucuronidase [Opitutaceae bacterium TSB47]